jgi:type I restriction enzyme S subunit
MEIIGGGTPSTKVKEYWDGDIPWISVKDFNNDRRFVSSTERSITQLGLHNSSTKMLERGDLIISARGTVGQVAQLSSEMAFNQTSYGLKAKPNMITNNFLYYLLRNMGDEIRGSTHGTVFDTITRRTFDTLCAKLPPLPTQKVITDTLSCLDDKIELNNKINENLEAQAQAIFKSWFVDFEPFQDGTFIESELGLIPEGWRVGKVGEYADLKSGFAFKSAWWVEEGVPVVRIGDIATNELRLEGAVRIGRDNVPQDETYHLRAGDFIIAMTGATIAKTALVPAIDELLLLNQRVGKFIPLSKNGFSLPFIFCFIRYPAIVDKIINLGSGSAQPNVSPSAIKSIPLILPPDKVLDDFNGICKPIFLKMLKAPIENRILSTVRDTLLPKLMSGEIEVPVE